MKEIRHIIAENRKRKKLTQPVLASRLEENGITVSYKTISGWEKGLSEPSIGTFIELCRILEIPDIYEAVYGQNPFDFTTGLNNEGRDKLYDYAQLLISSHKYDKNNEEPAATISVPRRLKLFDNRVSAGTGNFLTGDSYTWKEVGDEVPRNADFGLQITGDSMEPRYKDKQIVWVHQQSTLNNGEIGIFCLNGEAFCKKLQDEGNGPVLISLNEKYAPRTVRKHDEFTIFGRVLN
ncbi:MAG: helix-turn-helix domain-containing protein [Lachnospiraceae bacterium]|nr:helix-turn-helix domain-containing protein [Lachnospiraceae bacterium]